MRSFFPGAYVVRECDQRRCTVKGQLDEWVKGLAVMVGMCALHLTAVLLLGISELAWPWAMMMVVPLHFALRNNWITMMWEELEDEERAALADVSLPDLAKFWWGVLAVLCLGRGLQVAGVLEVLWLEIEQTIFAASL